MRRAEKAAMMNRMMRHGTMCLTLCWSGAVCAAVGTATAEIERGHRIFFGNEAITGKIEGHANMLPSSLGKCVNCHAAGPQSPLERRSAPLLNRASLVDPHFRRGGPASSYDKTSFCNTLRTGIDPQHVTLLRAMPRFEVSQAQCNALWSYLTAEP